MLNSFLYVDDLCYGANTVQDAYHLTSTTIEILKAAGFHLRKLKTNCPELYKLWNENGYEENTNFGQGTGFLGLKWDPIEDKIKLDLRDVRDSIDAGITKRHILRVISKIFDPCGLISPFVITVKIPLQEMWERGLQWDEDLPSDLHNKWRTWCSELCELESVSIERRFFESVEISEVSLRVFCDTSLKAYGAVAFLRYVNYNGQIKVSFIMSKSKVAPLKTLTLARLELMAALLAARLGNYLQGLFPNFVKQIFFWSDSQIVLHWLKGSSKQWKPFVANKVAQVQSLTLPECSNHCSGSDNPADLTTRGESARRILTSSLWWSGPVWLSKLLYSWPLQESLHHFNDICEERVIVKERRTALVNYMVTISANGNLPMSSLLDVKDFIELNRLLRVTAWIKRFVHNSKPNSTKLNGPICVPELEEALRFWIKATQFKHYSTEVTQLCSKGTIDKSSRIFNLNPELDDNNLLCLKGRLQFSSNDMRAKHPWLLPSNDKFVELLICDSHTKMCRLGVATLTHLREQFWIVKGRHFVKKALNNCLICRRFKMKSGIQLVAPLPPDRIQEHPPFDICGVDFAGPFFVRDFNPKCYLLIFSCAVTRGIHLEVVLNISADSFLLGFRRFVSRRGLCSTIYSDNTKAFKKANSELKKWWNQIDNDQVKNLFASKGIVWNFIVEKVHGGEVSGRDRYKRFNLLKENCWTIPSLFEGIGNCFFRN